MKTIQRLFLFLLSFLLLCYTLRAQVNLSSGLVAYYPFSGNTLDASGNNNTGQLSGSAVLSTDRWGNTNSACNMSGPNNPGRVTVANSSSLQFSTAASFSCWFKLNSDVGTSGTGNTVAGGSHCLFAKDGDAGGGLYALTDLNGSNLRIAIGNVSQTTMFYTMTGYTVGTWVHLVYVMDVTEQRMYVNGNLVLTNTGASSFTTMNTRQFCLGRFGSSWYPLDGALDEFRIYNRVLTTAEISSLSNNATVSATVSLISPSTACAGSAISVGISSTGSVSTGNTYTVQLSDAAGNFTYPVTIGTLVSNAATATVSCTIPSGVPSGSGYKLRVLTDVPVSTGPASVASLTVNGVLGDIPNASLFKYLGTLNGNNYYYCSTAQTWANAQSTCLANGGNLVTVGDVATNNFLRTYLSGGYFIGFTDQVTEGSFLWADGSPITYTNWNAGEPNNSGNEDYTQVNALTGTWNDVNSTVTSPFILQLRPAYNGGNACAGSSISLYAASLSGASYSWSGPNGFTSSQQNPVIANSTLAMAGTYTVTISNGGCQATATTTVGVYQSPDQMGQNATLPASLSSGLILYYPMDGNANDASGNNYNGTMFGGITTVADRFGNAGSALSFNGSNAYIDVPDNTWFNGTDFTVSCWVKANSWASWSRVFDFGNGPGNNNVLMAITSGTSGRPAAEIYNGSSSGGQIASGSTTIPTGTWSLMVYTWSNGTGRLYLNGTQLASGAQTAPQNVVRTICYIGRSNWSADAYANASFDDFRIYNRVITSTELTALLLQQPDAMNLVAMPAAICPNTATSIKVIGSQPGVSYQLQNASTSANIGAAQNGNGDTLSFASGTITATTSFQVVATGPGGCSVIISPVTVGVITAAGAPTTTGASRCGPGSVTLTASGAPNGAVYYWYTASTGGTPVFIGPGYTTPVLYSTTNYYVSIYANGCESNRTIVTATINLATAPAVDLYSGLIMHYKMDGNTADSSGRGNHSTLVTTGTYVNDRFGNPGKALSVSSNNYINCGTPADIQALTNQVTVSMWVNMNYFAGGQMPLLNDWANTGIYLGTYSYWDAFGVQQNRVRWRVDGNAYLDSYVNVPYGQWTLITCTYDGAWLKCYQDGQLTGSYNYIGSIGYTGTPTQIGRQANGSGSQIFAGIYDDVRVYSRALNADEALAVYFNDNAAFSNTPLCEGSTLQLSAPTIAGATYSWSGPNGFSSSQEDPAPLANVSSTNAGTYTLIITNTVNGCISGPQVNTVVVNPLPAAPVTVNDTVCTSGNALLTASGASDYYWYNSPSGGPVTHTGPSLAISNLAATDTFYVSAISASGCESISRSMVIAVYQNPVQTSLPTGGSSVCSGNPTATVTVQNSQPGVSYTAYYNNSAISSSVTGNGSTITITVNTATLVTGNNTITISATQPSCGTANLTNTATVTILPAPSAAISASGPLTFCTGDSVTLTAPAGLNYSWSNGASTQSITVNQAGTYSVTVTDANGCSAGSQAVSVSVLAPPVAVITAGGPLTFCQGDFVQLNASGGSSYSWSNGATTATVNISAAGSYYVIASNGSCTDTSAAVTVNVNPLPTVSFSMGTDTFFCVNSAALTLPAGSPAGGIYSGSGVSGNTFDPATAGAGSVFINYTYSDANGCSSSAGDWVTVDVCTGITEAGSIAAAAVPNPTNGNAMISWPGNAGISMLEVIDATGRLVISRKVDGLHSAEISLAGFAPGIYLVRLSGEEVLYLRLVRE